MPSQKYSQSMYGTSDGGGGGGPPTGAAGGDLGGTYPDPTVLALHLGATQITFGSIADGNLVKRAGTTLVGASPGTDYLTQAYTTIKSNTTTLAQRSNLKFSADFNVSDSTPDTVVALATAYVPQTTQVIAGTGLSGGGSLTGNVTVSMPAVGPGAGLIGGSGIASITLDAQGRVTAAATASYSPVLTFTNGVTRAINNVTNDLVTGVASNAGLTFDIASGANGTFNTTTNTTKGVFNFGATPTLIVSENLTYASGASATLDVLSVPARTVVITGSTSISTANGYNYVTVNPPTLSAGSALTVTTSSTLAVAGPPAGGGAGPATITNLDGVRVYGTWSNGTGTTGRAISLAPTFAPTSGSGAFRDISATYTINQSGGANGTITGLFVNGTETALTAGAVHNLLDMQVGGTSVFRVQSQGSTSAPNVLIGNNVSTVATTLLRADASRTVASATSATWDGIDILGATLTLTGTTHITTATGLNMVTVRAPTITDSSSVTVDYAATMAIIGGPTVSGSASLTNPYALWVQGVSSTVSPIFVTNAKAGSGIELQVSGTARTGMVLRDSSGTARGGVGYVVSSNDWAAGALAGGTALWSNTAIYIKPSSGSINLWSPATSGYGGVAAIAVQDSLIGLAFSSTTIQLTSTGIALAVASGGNVQFNTSATVASSSSAVWNGIDVIAATLTLSGSTHITTATGVNMVSFRAPSYSAASALTVDLAATVYIAGPPSGVGAGPCTITAPYSLWIDNGVFRYDGLVANGGGSTPTFGTIGASGPASAAQAGWSLINIDGTPSFVPVWR